MSTAKPTHITLHRASHLLEVRFDDGAAFQLPCEYLRVESPSAEVQGHSPDQKVLVSGKRHIQIEAIEAVGNYAVLLRFSDGHGSGLFTWDYLYELGQQQPQRWAAYLQALAAAGLSR